MKSPDYGVRTEQRLQGRRAVGGLPIYDMQNRMEGRNGANEGDGYFYSRRSSGLDKASAHTRSRISRAGAIRGRTDAAGRSAAWCWC